MRSLADAEVWIALIEAFGGARPESNGQGELWNALIDAVEGFSPGSGWPTVNGTGPGNLVAETAVDDTVGYQLTDQGTGGIFINAAGGDFCNAYLAAKVTEGPAGRAGLFTQNADGVNNRVECQGEGGIAIESDGGIGLTGTGLALSSTQGTALNDTSANGVTIGEGGTSGITIETTGSDETTGISLTTQASDTGGIALTDDGTGGLNLNTSGQAGINIGTADGLGWGLTADINGSIVLTAGNNGGSGNINLQAAEGIALTDLGQMGGSGTEIIQQGVGGILIETTGSDETTGIALVTNADDSGGISLTDNGAAGIALTGNLGFYGTSPITKPAVTGALSTVIDSAAKAVLTSIIAELAALGLVTDSTT